jgi:hypothetical protein
MLTTWCRRCWRSVHAGMLCCAVLCCAVLCCAVIPLVVTACCVHLLCQHAFAVLWCTWLSQHAVLCCHSLCPHAALWCHSLCQHAVLWCHAFCQHAGVQYITTPYRTCFVVFVSVSCRVVLSPCAATCRLVLSLLCLYTASLV